jgi:aryl-alcohol dehydrogenase-like predicted oxidoreductase
MTADRKFEGDDLRNRDPKFLPPRFEQYLAAVGRLRSYAKETHGRSVLDFAIRWILDRGDRMTALWGARSTSQLVAVEESMGWELTPADYEAVDKILAETIRDPIGPEFMAPPQRDV